MLMQLLFIAKAKAPQMFFFGESLMTLGQNYDLGGRRKNKQKKNTTKSKGNERKEKKRKKTAKAD